MDDTSKKSEPAVRRVVWGRQFLASTVVVPPDVAEHLNTDAMAVLAVIRNEAQASGKCSLPLARIAERANIGRAACRHVLFAMARGRRHVPLLSNAIEFHRTVTRWLHRVNEPGDEPAAATLSIRRAGISFRFDSFLPPPKYGACCVLPPS